MANPASIPFKRARQGCILDCRESDPNAKLVTLQDRDSWDTLLNAANIRKHKPIQDLTIGLGDGEFPLVQYHRKCRSSFVMPKTLKTIVSRQQSSSNEGTPTLERDRRSSIETTRVYENICLFCLTVQYLKGSRTRAPLVCCKQLRADSTLREAAARKNDGKILALLSRELVAAEGHYHRKCYRDYTRPVQAGSSDMEVDESQLDEDIGLYEDALQIAQEELFSFIRNDLFTNSDVVPLTDLSSKLVTKLHELGVIKVNDSTKKNLRRTLNTEFKETLKFLNDVNGRVLVYPSSLDIDETVLKYYSARQELRAAEKQTDDSSIITRAALLLRKAITSRDISDDWPPDTTTSNIPEPLGKFYSVLLTGDPNCDAQTERVSRLTTSFAQDLVYAVTNGKERTAKHVLLPNAVKSLTGNVELVHTLNRLGHCVSYSMMQQIDTALCLQKLSSGDDVLLPTDLRTGIFTTLVWDNIDRLEETLSGGGTSHRVNGIAIQQKDRCAEAGQRVLPRVPKTKKRSIPGEGPIIPIYNAGKRTGPKPYERVDSQFTTTVHATPIKNIAWVLVRLSSMPCQRVSSWTGFNIKLRSGIDILEDNIAYLPTVNAPATDLGTVYEVMARSLKIMQALNLNAIVCVFDQALYAKACEVVWKNPETFHPIVLRMGVFHTICTMLAVIGKRFGDAGLRDLSVESGVIADGSIAGVMNGKKYNRAIRLHKLMYEALLRLAWRGFQAWLGNEDKDKLAETLLRANAFAENITGETWLGFKVVDSCSHILKRFQDYLDFLRTGNGDLSTFWMSYVDMVEIVLGLVRASREGDFEHHLVCIRAMIPWCFAYDRLNYARYLPYYFATMCRLSLDYPDVYQHCMQGGISVQLGSSNPFGKIPCDQTIEETINKDTQTAGGTKGFSLKSGAVQKYYLNAEHRSLFLRQLREMVGLGGSRLNHPDLQHSRILKDEADVQSLVNLMEDSWINPFRSDQDSLVNLATAAMASTEIARDLMKASKVGEEVFEDFNTQRIESNTVDFFATMKKQKLKTFSDVYTKKVTCKGKDIVLKADRKLFGHIIVVAQTRKLEMKQVLSYPLGPIPWALANADGSLRKTDKAKFMNDIAQNVPVVEAFTEKSACIIDGMSIVQKVEGNQKTFGDIAKTVLKRALREGYKSDRVDVVFDVYREGSIKDAERVNRGSGSGVKFRSLAAGHKVKQWRSFLSEAQNKTMLIEFIAEEWKSNESKTMIGEKTLFVTSGQKCWCISQMGVSLVDDLRSSQEEADTRILLHAKHASDKGYTSVIVVSEDTDVFVLLIAFAKEIPASLYQKRGTSTRVRYMDIRKLRAVLGDKLSHALIAFHAFTGCDSVSAFSGRGKTGPLKQLKKDEVAIDAFVQLGTSWDVDQSLSSKLKEFTCRMYAASSKTCEVNILRHELFLSKRGEVDSSTLPPCDDSLKQHIDRANYQAGVWRGALLPMPDIPEPNGHGWSKRTDGGLDLVWMNGQVAPDAVLELLACQCKRKCVPDDCPCMENGFKCTYMCRLQTCENQKVEDETFENDSDCSDVDSDLDED